MKVFYIKNATTTAGTAGNLDDRPLGDRNPPCVRVQRAERDYGSRHRRSDRACGKADRGLDKPKAEVVVDVIVMEANRNRVRDLAATFTTGGAPGINIYPIVCGREGTGMATAMANGTAMVPGPATGPGLEPVRGRTGTGTNLNCGLWP